MTWFCRQVIIEYALKINDCVSSEHNEITNEVSFLNNKIQHSIGPRQTAKISITDISHARMCKVAASKKEKAVEDHELPAKS